MKKISISLIVALLIGGMLLNGCSNGTNQIINVETNSAESTKQETLKSSKLDSKLIELYQSTKEKQKENDERNIFGIDEAKFDKDGKLWVKCVEPGDIYREDQIMIENHVFTIYDSIDKHIQYWKEVGIKMNTEQVVSNNCFKDVVGKPEESTLQEFQTIENEFENMNDYYEELVNGNVSNTSTIVANQIENKDVNKKLTEKIYYYYTNSGTELHLSSSKPTSADYVEGQDDYIEFCKSFEDNSYIIKKEQVNNIVDFNSLMTISSYNAQNGYKKNDRKTYKKDGYILVTKDLYFEKIKKIIIDNKIVLNSYDYFFSEFKSVEDIINIGNLDLSLATSISHMFDGCSSLKKLDLSTFNTKNVIDMSSMFNNCESLIELNISNFNTENVVNMNSMFCYCIELQMLNIINFDTSNVTDMARMFSECYKLKEIDISNFNTKNVENMNYMFTCCEQLENINVVSFDTSKVKEMTGMFYGCIGLKSIDLSGFDFSNVGLSIWGPESYTVAGIAEMFSGCKNLQTIYSGQDIHINGFFEKTPVFKDCFDLVGGNGTKYNDSFNDISFAIIDTDYQMGYFTYDPSRYY